MAGLVCGHCGATNPAGSRFCASCDGFLDWEGEPEAVDTAPAAPAGRAPAAPVDRGPAPDAYQPPAQPVQPTPAQPPPRPVEPFPDPRGGQYQTTQPLVPQPDGREVPPVGPAASLAAVDTEPGILRCPNCATGNPPGRRFCRRCGEWVVDPGPPVDVGPMARRRGGDRPWWKPFGGEKPAYTKPLTSATIAFRSLIAVAVLVIGSLLLGLFGLNPIGRGRDYVQHLLGSGRVEGVTAVSEPAEAVDDHPADWAVDDVRGRAWTATWTAAEPAGPEDACAGEPASAVGQVLVVEFPGPTNVREIGVEAGLMKDDDLRTTRYRPRTLRLDWAGGGCQSVRLDDDAKLQRFAVRQKRDLTGVRVTVVGGYQPADGGNRLDIGELTFWRR
jgi:hypothetical protein